MQRVEEVQKVVEVLEALDEGLLPQGSNVLKGRAALDEKFFQGRLNLSHLAMHGHSFGAATAIAVCGVDKRFKCCVAEDVWWAPVEEVGSLALTSRSLAYRYFIIPNSETLVWMLTQIAIRMALV